MFGHVSLLPCWNLSIPAVTLMLLTDVYIHHAGIEQRMFVICTTSIITPVFFALKHSVDGYSSSEMVFISEVCL